jgi:two-component system, OmpR family, response regulator MtrA
MRVLMCGLGSILTNAMDCRLRKYGCRVVKAYDTNDALNRIQNGSVDILVTSVGLSNFKITHFVGLIRESMNKDLPIILVAEPDDNMDNVLEGIEAGADDFVTFPLKPYELIMRINLLVHKCLNH